MSLSPKVYKRPPVAGTAFYPLPAKASPKAASERLQHREQELAALRTADPLHDGSQPADSLKIPAESAADPPGEQQIGPRLRAGHEQGLDIAEPQRCQSEQEALIKLKEAELCLREARQKSKEILASAELKMVELAIAAAEQLIKTQLELAPEKIIHVVRNTLRLIDGTGKLAVYVSPADLSTCLELQEKLAAEFREIDRLEIFPDGALSRGSCRVESESGAAEYLLQEESCRLRELLLNIARREERKPNKEQGANGDH